LGFSRAISDGAQAEPTTEEDWVRQLGRQAKLIAEGDPQGEARSAE
jgi:hypothetical protein